MKNNRTNWLAIAVTAIVGILLIVWHTRIEILSWVIIATGAMFIIPSIYSLCRAATSRRNNLPTPWASILTSIAGICLGLWMIITPDVFVSFTAYLFAAILIIFGIYQILTVEYRNRPFRIPFFFYIIPILSVAAGITIICTPIRTMNSIVVLLTGILLVASAVSRAFEFSATHPVGTHGGNAV